jgi:hypothetical protein
MGMVESVKDDRKTYTVVRNKHIIYLRSDQVWHPIHDDWEWSNWLMSQMADRNSHGRVFEGAKFDGAEILEDIFNWEIKLALMEPKPKSKTIVRT